MNGRTDPVSPGMDSNASFDFGIITADKAARQDQLEALYGAALEQEAKDSQIRVTQEAVQPKDHVSGPRNAPRPPRLLTSALANSQLRVSSDATSPVSVRSPVRAIYPPGAEPQGHPVSSGRPAFSSNAQRSPISPGSTGSRASGSSNFRSYIGGHGANKKRIRNTLRNLHISSPMPKSPNDTSDSEGHTPLTPRYYTDPGAPPSPPTRSEAPTTPATYQTESEDEYNVEQMDQIRDLPMAAPQRRNDNQHLTVPGGPHNTTTTTTAPPTAATSTSTLGTLPFRAMSHEQQQQPTDALRSPGLNTKTTYVERRRDLFNNAPRTGAATPYTPYMPFTPVTPVTPHLTSRAERKQKQKEKGRKAVSEEDQVQEEGEMWGSGY